LSGEGGGLQDVVNIVRDQKLAYKEIDEVTKKFFNFDIKKYSEVELNKTIKDFADTYGLDHAQLMKLKREELVSLPEVVGIERYIMDRAMEDLGNKAKKLSEAVADGTPDSKKSLQMRVISFADAYSGMKKISEQAAQRRSEAGRTLSLYRKSTKERLFEQVTSKELDIPNILSDEVQMKFIEKLMSAEPGEMKRVGNKINDIMKLVKKNKLSSEDVWKQFVKGESLDKITHNLSVYAYNNMLWGVTTMLKNYVGLHINRQVDKLEDAIVKYTNESAYYGMEDFDLDHQREILEVMARLDSNIEGSLNLVNSSKLLPGLVNADGTAKSSKQIWKESYLLGKSMLDPGSEKFGVGYKSFTETDKAVLKAHFNFFEGESVTDDMVRSYFNDSIMNDASKATSGNKYWEGLKVHAAAPLRALNATDDMFKAKILQEKMLLYAKQKVNKRLSGMNDEAFNAYRQDLDNNYYKDLQAEMNDIDNFDDAMSTARETTLTKQYGSGYGGDQLKYGRVDVGRVSSAFQNSKLVRFFYPFARISTNIADYLTQLTPGMHVPEGVPLIGGKAFHINSKMVEELSAGGYRSAKARAKVKVGLAISGMAAYMARTNLITGSEPEDRAGREAWRAAGLKADSLNLPGFSVPLNLIDPFGKYLKMIADMSNTAARHINDGDDGYLDDIVPFSISTAFSVARLATPEVLVETLGAIAEASSRTQRYGLKATGAAAFSKIVGTITSKGIPFSAMFRYIAGPDEMQRTFEYNKDGVDELATGWNAFNKNMFMKTTSVKNLFNDSVYHYNLPKDLVSDASDQSMINKYVPQFISKIAKIKETPREPIYKKLRELVLDLPASTYKSKDLPLPSLKRHISFRGETVALNNTQYNELIGYTNGYLPDGSTFMLPMKEYLNDLVTKEWFNNTDVDLQSLMIRQVVGKYHKLGRGMFKARNEEYQKDMLNKVHKRMGLE
jgi:hypothetical protein